MPAYSASSYGRLDNLEEQKMTVETESNRKLDKFIETTSQKFDDVNTSLTSIQVNQARVEGEVKTLDVKIENLQKGQDEVKANLSAFKTETKENFKEVQSELKETRKDISGLYKWVIGLIVTLGIGILTLGIGIVTIIFRVFDLFPKA